MLEGPAKIFCFDERGTNLSKFCALFGEIASVFVDRGSLLGAIANEQVKSTSTAGDFETSRSSGYLPVVGEFRTGSSTFFIGDTIWDVATLSELYRKHYNERRSPV